MILGNSEERRGGRILTLAKIATCALAVMAVFPAALANRREEIATFRIGIIAEPGAADGVPVWAERDRHRTL
jgi:hypothetical protein